MKRREFLLNIDGEEARLENVMNGDQATITTEQRLMTVVVTIHAKSSH